MTRQMMDDIVNTLLYFLLFGFALLLISLDLY